jgi:hypothetical protein
MTLGGQWIAKYEGTGKGTLVVDIDEIDNHFEILACAWNDALHMPSTSGFIFNNDTRTGAEVSKRNAVSFGRIGQTSRCRHIGTARNLISSFRGS